MSYTKTTWVNGDKITAEKLNHLENGVEAASETKLPASTAADAGKVLTVGETGAAEWAAASGEAFNPLIIDIDIDYDTGNLSTTTTCGELKNAITDNRMVFIRSTTVVVSSNATVSTWNTVLANVTRETVQQGMGTVVSVIGEMAGTQIACANFSDEQTLLDDNDPLWISIPSPS